MPIFNNMIAIRNVPIITLAIDNTLYQLVDCISVIGISVKNHIGTSLVAMYVVKSACVMKNYRVFFRGIRFIMASITLTANILNHITLETFVLYCLLG